MLPRVPRARLNIRPIDWSGLPRRFLNPGELEVLVALVRMTPARRIIEIGVNEGRTAAAILRAVGSVESYVGIDVPPGYSFKCAVQAHETPAEPGKYALADGRFRLIVRKRGSRDVTADELGPADFVFIDGDHSAAAVMADSKLATELVRPGGMIVWHDYHEHETVEVRPTLEALAAAGRPICHVENTWIAFERR